MGVAMLLDLMLVFYHNCPITTTYPATEILTTSVMWNKRKEMPLPRSESSALKSAVNLFSTLPTGTVSSHLNGACRMATVSLSKSVLLARIEPIYTQKYLNVDVQTSTRDSATYTQR